MASLKELSQESQDAFVQLVPHAVAVPKEEALFVVQAGGVGGPVRVKRAAGTANQIHVGRGEPIALHVPGKTSDKWYVLTVAWQLQYARRNPNAAQHASHPFDCMAVRSVSLPDALRVEPADLGAACAKAAAAAAHPANRALVEAIRKTRDAVADILIDTLGGVIDAMVTNPDNGGSQS